MEDRKRDVRVRCDKCSHIWDIETWLVIDEQKDQEAVQMVCDGVYFTHFCPVCGEEYKFVAPTIYTDFEKMVMICFVDNVIEIAATQAIINQIASRLGVDVTKAHIRVATTCNEFQEKVMLVRDGLDDRVAELMKLWGLEVIRKEGYDQLFDEARCGINSKTGQVFIDYIGKKPRHIEVDRSFYDKFAAKMIESLNKEATPLEVNADWAINFSETHDC